MVDKAETRRMSRRVILNGKEMRPSGRKDRSPKGFVPSGTRGMYDPDPKTKTKVARAMAENRHRVLVSCAVPECVDPETGQPRVFSSRLRNGAPEQRACSGAHRILLWRREMAEKGYKQVTRNGLLGWMSSDGLFMPNPSQPRKRSQAGRRRKSRAAGAKAQDSG